MWIPKIWHYISAMGKSKKKYQKLISCKNYRIYFYLILCKALGSRKKTLWQGAVSLAYWIYAKKGRCRHCNRGGTGPEGWGPLIKPFIMKCIYENYKLYICVINTNYFLFIVNRKTWVIWKGNERNAFFCTPFSFDLYEF